MLLHWQKDLGSPTKPCVVSIMDVGQVRVEQRHIELAAQVGGRVRFTGIDVTSGDSNGREFILGLAQPE